MLTFINKSPTIKSFTILCFIAFIIRAATFQFFIKPEYRYHQADSLDYHCSGALYIFVKLWHQHSISRRVTLNRLFGALLVTLIFYHSFINIWDFVALILKKILRLKRLLYGYRFFYAPFLPILVFFLAQLLTKSLTIAWIGAIISVFHLGFILSSTFLFNKRTSGIIFYRFFNFSL